MKMRIVFLTILLLQFLVGFKTTSSLAVNVNSDTYMNMRIWNVETGRCFFFQQTTNSCVSASVQMVLKYLDYSPLPNQTELAIEMRTDINHTTEWKYTYIPFQNRGFSEYFNQSLSDFQEALFCLKGNLSQNYPIIIDTWLDENAKSAGSITHARVVTGYNLTGIFFNDPWSGPNEFLNYSEFSSLWNVDGEFWALIIEREPKFDISVGVKDWFGNPIQGVQLLLDDGSNFTEVTDSRGIAQFSNLSISNYTLSYNWRFQSGRCNVALVDTKDVDVSLCLSNETILLVVVILASVTVAIVAIGRKRAHKR